MAVPSYVVQPAIPSVERLWPDAERGPWVLRIDIQVIDGRPEPYALSLSPVDSKQPAPLRAATLRELRLSEITHSHLDSERDALASRLDSLKAAMEEDLDLANEVPTSMLKEWQGELDDLASAQRRPGRPVEVTEANYREVADIYRAALASGQPVIRTIATRLVISEATAAKRIRNARKLGYLPPTSRGKARSALEETT